MTARQKVGWSLVASGGISVGAGFLVALTTVTPAWVPIVLQVLGYLFPAIGLSVTIPNLKD